MIHRKLQAIFLIILLITACQTSPASETAPVESMQAEAVASQTATPEPIPSATVVPPSPTPNYSPTPDTRLTSHYWREWPVVPPLSIYAQTILANALQGGKLDPHTFSKVGDCQMTSDTFLGGYALGKYPIPDGHEATVEWFSISMTSESVTAEKGLGISSVLNPMFGFGAGYKQCKRNESPIDCELRTRKPAVVLIGMGTNWIPNAELKFDQYLREVVDTIINAGALSHTSVAIRDAFAACEMPYVEVHISNIFAREPERRHSALAGGASGFICGLGAEGYELALRGLVARLTRRG